MHQELIINVCIFLNNLEHTILLLSNFSLLFVARLKRLARQLLELELCSAVSRFGINLGLLSRSFILCQLLVCFCNLFMLCFQPFLGLCFEFFSGCIFFCLLSLLFFSMLEAVKLVSDAIIKLSVPFVGCDVEEFLGELLPSLISNCDTLKHILHQVHREHLCFSIFFLILEVVFNCLLPAYLLIVIWLEVPPFRFWSVIRNLFLGNFVIAI